MSKSLSHAQIETIRALSEVLIPAGGSLPPSAPEAGVHDRIDRWVSLFPRVLRRRFKLLVYFWDISPVTASGFRRPFRRLSREQRDKWVEISYRSPRLDRRLPLAYLKQLIFMAYTSSPVIEEALGFDYTCRLEGIAHGEPMTSISHHSQELPAK